MTSSTPTSRRLSQLQSKPAAVSDKIEIDSDNVETPPAQRRLFKDAGTTTGTAGATGAAPTTPNRTDPGNAYTDLGSGNCTCCHSQYTIKTFTICAICTMQYNEIYTIFCTLRSARFEMHLARLVSRAMTQ